MGNGSGKSDEAVESNNLRCSKLAKIAKIDSEPVTSVTLVSCWLTDRWMDG